MSIDISIFGLVRFYSALVCPWSAVAIGGPDGSGWEFCSLHLSLQLKSGTWYLGWAWDSDLVSLMFGHWDWEWPK